MSLALALAAGVAVGALLGMLGGGGSILAVPVLIGLLDQDPHAATTTSLLVVGTAALFGTVDQWHAKAVRWRTAIVMSLAAVPGSLIGATVNDAVDATTLVRLLATLLAAVAVLTWIRAGRSPEGAPSAATTSWLTCIPSAFAGLGVGVLTGLFGVGGGFVIVPILVLLVRMPIREAIGTSILIIAIVSSVAFVAHMAGGATVDWSVAIPFTSATVAGAIAGSRLGRRIHPSRLARGFAVLLVAVATALVLTA